MTKKLVVPANIAKMLADKHITTVDSMDTGGGGVSRISLKNRKFTIKDGDDDIKLGESINVVIVGITPQFGYTKTYYATGYSPGESSAPDCQSTDGLKPDGYVDSPVSDNCKTCEKNQWGSAKSRTGKKAKACHDSKRLHVILADEFENDDPTIHILTVTVMSLRPFGNYGKTLAKAGIPTPAIVITGLSFDEEATVPMLEFELVGVMDEKLCIKSIDIAEEAPWDAWKKNTPALAATPKAKLEAPANTAELESADAWDN